MVELCHFYILPKMENVTLVAQSVCKFFSARSKPYQGTSLKNKINLGYEQVYFDQVNLVLEIVMFYSYNYVRYPIEIDRHYIERDF